MREEAACAFAPRSQEKVQEDTMKSVLCVLCMATALAGCATTGGRSTENDVAAIKQIWASYCACVMKGDSTGYLALWDAGGIQLRPNAPSRTKQEMDVQVPAAFKASVEANDISMTINPLEVTVDGAWAYSRGSYAQELRNKSTGATTNVDGKFLTVFKRQDDGSWRIYRDCFNSNAVPK